MTTVDFVQNWLNKRNDSGIYIACVGEVMIELSGLDFAGANAKLKIAGDTMNTAVYLKRAAADNISVSYLTALGQDDTSAAMIKDMNAHGLDTATIGRHADRLPGIYAIELDDKGERSFRYWRSQSAAKTMFAETAPSFDDLSAFEVIYLSGISLAILPGEVQKALATKLADLSGNGHLVVFDTNYRPAIWTSADQAAACYDMIWPSVAIGLPSIEDLDAIYGVHSTQAHTKRLTDMGVKELVLRRGEQQPCLWSGRDLDIPTLPPASKIVDTTGAGDSFNGAYIAARLDGQDCASAVVTAHDMALKVIAVSGAIIPNNS